MAPTLFVCSQTDKTPTHYRGHPITFLITVKRPNNTYTASPLSYWMDFGESDASTRRRVDHELRPLLSVVTTLRLDCVSSLNRSVIEELTARAENVDGLMGGSIIHKFMQTGTYEVSFDFIVLRGGERFLRAPQITCR